MVNDVYLHDTMITFKTFKINVLNKIRTFKIILQF